MRIELDLPEDGPDQQQEAERVRQTKELRIGVNRGYAVFRPSGAQLPAHVPH